MRSLGKTVLILEKTALIGGTMARRPGSTPERGRTYLTEAPRMVDFLVSQGVKLDRISEWPDYYDDLPGGSVSGRTVVAKLFNVNELEAWKQKLQPMFIRAPVELLQSSGPRSP
jgi:3-oxosteroid 1-dehydrogenase